MSERRAPAIRLERRAPAIRLERRAPATWAVPIASTLAGSCVTLLPIVAEVPVLPSFGLLVALGWRLLRPELWGPWVALPLGLADDLIAGAPLGTGMALWTLAFLGLEIADHFRLWRDAAADWQLAAAAIAFVGFGGWLLARLAGGAGPLWTIVPPIAIGVAAMPFVMRLVAMLDRWRLRNY